MQLYESQMILVRFAGAMLYPRSGEACFALLGQSMAPDCGSIVIGIMGPANV